MSTDIDNILSNSKIGDSVTATLVDAEQNCAASIALVDQARYTLDIVSRDLNHALYDNDAFEEVVKQLATSSRKARIRILIQDSDKAVKQGHRIVELARRISSFIEIRVQGKQFKEFNEAWLIVDAKAWIRRPLVDRYHAEINYSAARQLRDIVKEFDNMWNYASPDPNLRRLSI